MAGFRWAALGLAALALAACDSAEERVAGHNDRGAALLAEGEPVKASLEFRNALRLDDANVAARIGLAEALQAQGEFRGALGNFRAAVEADPASLRARLGAGALLLVAGALDAAQVEAVALADLAPDDVEALAFRAAVATRLGDTEKAQALAERALALKPGDADANIVLIGVRLAREDPDGALALADAAIATAPNDERLRLLRLRLLGDRGDADAVGVELREIVARFPGKPAYRRTLARWHAARGDLDAAEAAFRALAEAAEGGAAQTARLDVVRFLLEARGDAAAREELARLIAEGGEEIFAYEVALAELDWRDGARDAVRARFERLAREAATAEQRAEASIRVAQLEFDIGEIDAVARRVAAVLEDDARNVDALALRARVAMQQYRADDAVLDLRTALSADPQNAELLLLSAQANELNGNPGLASENLAQATRVSAFRPEIATRYAMRLRAEGNRAGAETVLSEALRRHPRDRAVLEALARIRIELEDWTGAEEVAAQLGALDEMGDVAAAQVRAAALTGQGQLSDSIALLESVAGASAAADERDQALGSLISTYVRAGETAKAGAFLDGLIAENPRNVRALLLRAELHVLAGEIDAAITRLRAIIDAAPDSSLGFITLGRLQVQLGRMEEAEATVRTGVEASEDDLALRLLLAQLLETRKAYDEAIAEYALLHERLPNSILVANNLASLVAEFRADDAESLKLAAKVAQRLRASEVPQFQDTFGWIMFLTGEYDLALRSLRAAAEALPDNTLVRYHAGRAYAALDLTEEARGHLTAALALEPDFPKAASAREALAALDAAPAAQ